MDLLRGVLRPYCWKTSGIDEGLTAKVDSYHWIVGGDKASLPPPFALPLDIKVQRNTIRREGRNPLGIDIQDARPNLPFGFAPFLGAKGLWVENLD